MRRTISLPVVASLSLLALPAVGRADGGNVVMIHCVDVQQGAQAQFEQGVKKHMNWHRTQKDTWSWLGWTVLSGPDSGRHCFGSFDHKWEDFDKPAVSMQADEADVMVNFASFVKKHEASFWTRLSEVSRPAPQPAPMSSVVFFYARFGMDDEFNSLIGEFHKAIEKTQMPWKYQWYALASGGEGGTYALVLPRANFASFNPSGKPFNEMLEEAYGKTAANALLDRWHKVVERSENHLIQGRPDLSYTATP
jgi:hypothetical protein